MMLVLQIFCSIITGLFLAYCAGRMFGLGMGKSLLNITRKERITESVVKFS